MTPWMQGYLIGCAVTWGAIALGGQLGRWRNAWDAKRRKAAWTPNEPEGFYVTCGLCHNTRPVALECTVRGVTHSAHLGGILIGTMEYAVCAECAAVLRHAESGR